MKISSIKNSIRKILILSFWLILWEIASLVINREIYLPSPITTFKSLMTILSNSNTYVIILSSTYRTILGITFSCVLGIIFGFICGLNKFMYELFNPIVIFIRTTPIVSIIILAIIWLSSSHVPIFSSFLMCFPVIFTSIAEGIRSTDKKLTDMCKVYRIGIGDKIKYIYLHTITPYFHSAIISSIGISWKATTAAEVLSMPKNSIGSNLFYAKIYLEPETLFAWTIIIVIISALFEKLYVRAFKYDKAK